MHKEEYIGLDKEYELEILFGYTTDTHDVLGYVDTFITYNSKDLALQIEKDTLEDFVGQFDQEYPAFSSKNVAYRL